MAYMQSGIEGGDATPVDTASDTSMDAVSAAREAVDLMLSIMSDDLDHPELWPLVPALAAENPLIPPMLEERRKGEWGLRIPRIVQLLLGLSLIATEGPEAALAALIPLSSTQSQNVQVQGAIFHVEGLLDPQNPKYDLAGKVCTKPFIELDVLEGSTHLCCASWLPTSTGNLANSGWQDIWNGDTARAIRESVTDGSYRFCNKRTCPTIQASQFQTFEELDSDPRWRDIMANRQTLMPRGPEMVNLAYDRTCNLSCPSCRTERYAADDATRARYNAMQEREIMPLLTNAKTVFVTGSGDPFASKNFRHLMSQLTAKDYPDLKFIIMTNGMLFTPRQWEAFPSLHGRVESLRISVDAATGPTHELLRRGAQWAVMEKNLEFAGQLFADGLVDDFMLSFTVQVENYREMGAAVDLTRRVGARQIYFGSITNWGTFSPAEYDRKAVFNPGHPEHQDFLAACRDPSLSGPLVALSNLDEFISASCRFGEVSPGSEAITLQ